MNAEMTMQQASNHFSEEQIVERALDIAERLEMLAKSAIRGAEKKERHTMELDSSDAFAAVSLMLELAREQQRILTESSSL